LEPPDQKSRVKNKKRKTHKGDNPKKKKQMADDSWD